VTDTTSRPDCIFCKIVNGEFGTESVAESEHAVAFRDLNPQAPTHVLVVPRRHIPALRVVGPDDGALVAEALTLAVEVARREGLLEGGGFRVITNDGPDAGQTIYHLHFHVLGGQSLAPMG
jgi:histidine triad (HIT) family protein